jgi:tetratricopeptide (TPR) repeat protein
MERRVFAGGAAAAVTAMLVHSLVDFNLHIPANAQLFATIMGLTVAMGNGVNENWRITLKPLWRVGHAAVVLAIAVAWGWTGISTVLANRYTAKGYDASQFYNWPEALNNYQRALRLDSKNPETHVQMGDMYWTQATLLEDLEGVNLTPLALKAAGAYERSLALNPYQSIVLLRLALVLEMTGDKDAALNAYQRALAVDPDNAFVLLRLGIFYQRTGDKARAIATLQRSATLNSNEPVAQDLLKELQAQ